MKLLKELLMEAPRKSLDHEKTNLKSVDWSYKGFDPKKGWITGGGVTSNNWSRDEIKQAIADVKLTPEFKKLAKKMNYVSTQKEEYNGTLAFEQTVGKTAGQNLNIYLGGQIRLMTTSTGRIAPTRIKSPKPAFIAGDAVKSAVKTYVNAMKVLIDRHDDRLDKEV